MSREYTDLQMLRNAVQEAPAENHAQAVINVISAMFEQLPEGDAFYGYLYDAIASAYVNKYSFYHEED